MASPEAVCRHKLAYSKSAAIRAVNRGRDVSKVELTYYRCPACKRYHLTRKR